MYKANIGDKKSSHGYISIYLPQHPYANAYGWIMEHRVVAGKALEKPLPPAHIVHHIDLDGKNNANTNLVICQDMDYHALLHQRTRSVKACGNANYRKCIHCHKYDKTENMTKHLYHPACIKLAGKKATEKRRRFRNRDKVTASL